MCKGISLNSWKLWRPPSVQRQAWRRGGFPPGLPRTQGVECFRLLRARWPRGCPGKVVGGSSSPPGHLNPRAGGQPRGRLKPWGLVPVNEILFSPHSVCPGSGKPEFHYSSNGVQGRSRMRPSWKLFWSWRHNLFSAKPGPGRFGDAVSGVTVGENGNSGLAGGSLQPAGQAVWAALL